ncbi:Sua5/YciO/YrdC/YwlC family protein [Paraglaciecola chathamensis]|uniref:Threonylcarbamoyl-AMP synthase n=1 Tax=Paraglaciecola agarilytica NO2 TaxID=1125747 RepID=A0ABQ0IAH4_9ALTE|nr:Sua5/YciO/YrdC/YwlC family protein [Paraglaciecola agarilytica]GAC06283.1 tRNA threonylcarbamoyladenosine biosynthesis protein [Paraglaciecola agarilytica NO2]
MTTNHSDDPFLIDFLAGKVFAYPTEAVFGLGCDPDNEQAVSKLLLLKERDVSKGLILVADNYSQLLPYVNDDAIKMTKRTEIFSSWPGPVTWLLPKAKNAPAWVTGDSEFIAVRVSAHPVIKDLCSRVNKPLISTSANTAGNPPALNSDEVKSYFSDQVALIEGSLGGSLSPSKILHGHSGQTIRDN